MTNIEWTDVTWNPIRGCRNRCWADDAHPEGNCYAAAMARRKLGPQIGCPRCDDFLDVHPHEKRLLEPLRWRKPRWVFAGSMTDFWTDDEPDDVSFREARRRVWRTIALARRHTFVILTKRPERIDWQELHTEGERAIAGTWRGENLIVGTSVPDASTFGRLPQLKLNLWAQAPRYFTPRLLACFEPFHERGSLPATFDLSGFAWAIVGAPTGLLRSRLGEPSMQALNAIGLETLRVQIPLFVKDNALDLCPTWMQDARARPE